MQTLFEDMENCRFQFFLGHVAHTPGAHRFTTSCRFSHGVIISHCYSLDTYKVNIMPIDLYWDNHDKTVLLCAFRARWTWDELYAMLAAAQQVSAQQPQRVALILDIGGLGAPGGALLSRAGLAHAQRLLALNKAGERGAIVIAGQNGLLRTLFETLQKMDSRAVQDVYFAPNVEAARALLRADRTPPRARR